MTIRAKIADTLILPSRAEKGSARRGVIIDVGEGGEPPFVVRWEDGTTSRVYPSTAARIASPAERREDPLPSDA